MSWTAERARYAALSRSRQPDDPDLVAAHRNLRALRLEEHVRRVLAAAPPLSDEQRTKLAELLRPVRRPAPARDRKTAVAERIATMDGGDAA